MDQFEARVIAPEVKKTQVVRYMRARDGMVAILYSPGFGAGWFTWNPECYDLLIFDSAIVKTVLALGDKERTMEDFEKIEEVTKRRFEEIYGRECDLYLGGAGSLTIKWVPLGTKFYIREYDGAESVVLADEFMTA